MPAHRWRTPSMAGFAAPPLREPMTPSSQRGRTRYRLLRETALPVPRHGRTTWPLLWPAMPGPPAASPSRSEYALGTGSPTPIAPLRSPALALRSESAAHEPSQVESLGEPTSATARSPRHQALAAQATGGEAQPAPALLARLPVGTSPAPPVHGALSHQRFAFPGGSAQSAASASWSRYSSARRSSLPASAR